MSSISEVEIDLEKLFLPAWAQGKPAANPYAKFAGEPPEREDRRREGRHGGPRPDSFGERRGPRPPRAGGKFGDRKKGFSSAMTGANAVPQCGISSRPHRCRKSLSPFCRMKWVSNHSRARLR